ncbi:hypothetical protein [Rhizobium sp. AC27/96]|uniref:hypothetical protein n=1 Tax=Rhizobium sp. AC27/96 TaxID=1841653 RepID=UPI0013016659|nr:hypothetical protein [Rhizobium sp. AC27/96]
MHARLAAYQHTGRNNGPIEYANMTEEEIDARIAAIIASAGEDAYRLKTPPTPIFAYLT